MRERRKMARGGRLRVHREIARVAHGGRPRVGVGEQEPREPPGEGRLADPLRAADQPGVREPAVAIGREHRGLGLLVADQRLRVARMRRARDPVALRRLVGLGPSHRVAPAAPCGSSRAATAAQMSASTSSSDFSASITTQRPGSAAAMSR